MALSQKKGGKLKTKIKLTFTPKSGAKQVKDRHGQLQKVDEMIRAENRAMEKIGVWGFW